MSDALFKAATDFLVNGGELPDEVKADPRATFLSAILKDVHANGKENTNQIVKLDKRTTKIETLLKWAAGILGTSATILGILAKLSVI